MNQLLKSILVIIAGAIIVSCSNENVEPIQENILKSEISSFFETADFQTFSSNFSDVSSNLDFERMSKMEYSETAVLYSIPAINNETQLTFLNVLKNSDGTFNSFYEVRSFTANKENAVITYFTLDNLEVISFNAMKSPDTNMYEIDLSEMYTGPVVESCTGDCYKTAKDACDGDGDCKLLCDLLDIAGGQCTISIATACFIHCVF